MSLNKVENGATAKADAETSTSGKQEDGFHYGELRVSRFISPPLTLIYSNPFLRTVETQFHFALAFGDKDTQNRAKALIPVTCLEINAQKNLRALQEQLKKGKLDDPEVSVQDMLLLELLAWFKNDFFLWVDTPSCINCGGKTVMSHMSSEAKDLVYTNRVEVYVCETCKTLTNFPRYNDLNILLETRRGRCGEWALAFTLMCRALGWDSRFIVDELDHVWTEVYSVTQKRWVHCDPCENACDTPLMYETGWNKKLTYVMAYSPEEVQDVTWRYSSNHKQVLSRRKKCEEEKLVEALMTLRKKRQESFSQTKKNYLARRLLAELVELMVERMPNADEHQGRISGSMAWRTSRGETQNKANYVWKIRNHQIQNDCLTIQYSTSLDRYEFVSGNGKITKVKGWSSGVFSFSNIFRKDEKDWKTVYLARSEGTNSGSISWKFELETDDRVINTVSLTFIRQLYEDGVIDVKLHSDRISVDLPKDTQTFTTTSFSGLNNVMITAYLSGGKGNVAWQHTQLFRQPSDSQDFPFHITFDLKSGKM